MTTMYREIEFGAGDSIDNAVATLEFYKQKGELVFGVFNGHRLYSDVDTIDSAYKRITGKTKAQFDAYMDECNKEHNRSEEEHMAAIPQLTIEWIDKGANVLDEEYMELWKEVVPIRLGDLYHGMELGCTLDIVSMLNNGCEFSEAQKIIEQQGHSGMSFALVCSMIKSFSKRGEGFVTFIKK